MKIKKVLIVCHKKDMYLLRSCVASIKYWHPEVGIFLLKDQIAGDFDTLEIQKYFGAKIYSGFRKAWGWGWAKIAPFVDKNGERYLVLDADTVLVGKVLDELSRFDEDFIVTGIESVDSHNYNVNKHYLEVADAQKMNSHYKFPGYAFNSGQMVVTGSYLNILDFEEVVDFGTSIKCKFPEIFKYADQGVLNYILASKREKKDYTIKYCDFWIWPEDPRMDTIKIENLESDNGYPFVVHWAGVKKVNVKKFPRYDIHKFYSDIYYESIPNGKFKKLLRSTIKQSITYIKIFSYKMRGLKYS